MSQIDEVLYTTLKSLLARPRPFLLYTDSLIYRVRQIVSLDQPDRSGASIVLQTQLGEKSVALSDVEDVVIREEGFPGVTGGRLAPQSSARMVETKPSASILTTLSQRSLDTPEVNFRRLISRATIQKWSC